MITKAANDLTGLDFSEGQIILIDKPSGWSSFKVVRKIKHVTGIKKVGHAGTLDPLATGLLIIATGKKTKELSQYQSLDKTYSGTILLGKTSPSMDTETESTSDLRTDHITEEHIYSVRNEFLGIIKQIPPMYSALKHKGKNLYKYARKGKEIERQAREVTVSAFDITSIKIPYIGFLITCSKGTYIRVIANDFGEKLGCGGVLSSLKREKIGNYSVQDALTIDEFTKKFTGSGLYSQN